MKKKQVLYEKKKNIATIILNNPEHFNSMTWELIADALQAIKEAEADREVRVVVLTGAGKAFCAGGDLSTIESFADSHESCRYLDNIGAVTKAIVNMPKPVIAMVNGVAAGGGCNWMLACDIIFCAASARFTQSFTRIGLIPDSGGTFFLTRAIGLYRAKEMAFTGEVMDARQAFQIGLVNRIVDDDQLQAITYQFAEGLAKNAPIALGLTKKALNQGVGLNLDACLQMETDIQLICINTKDHKEGIAAFKGKRVPSFKGN